MPSNHLILCCPLLLLPSIFQHQSLFQWVSYSHHVAKVLEFSASVSVLPVNIQDWFPLGLIGLISLQSKGLSRVENQHHSSKTSVRWHSAFLIEALTREDILKCFPQYMWFVTREVTNLGFFSMAPSKQHEQQKTVIFSLNLWREYPVLEFWLIYTPYLGPSTGKVWENLFCKY